MNIEGYNKKFIAFIDILGFKNLIDGIESNSKTSKTDFKKVQSILNFLNEESIDSNGQHDLPVYEKTDDGYVEKELGNPIITYVSDCVIISTDGTFDGFKSICNKITKLYTDIASDGIFLRGAIVYGNIYHKDRILFGSGYVKSYLLEEKKAIFPRVIIDESVFDFLKDHQGKFPLNENGIKTDLNDKEKYLRLFPFNYYPYYTVYWLDFLLRVKAHILYHLNMYDTSVKGYDKELKELDKFCCWRERYTWDLDFTGGNQRVLEKYIWIKDEFNETINKYSKFLTNEQNEMRISKIVFKSNHWGAEKTLGHRR
ncbi:MAG: hypothetical protein ACPGU9_06205 [Flavobacteriaceae bacterium]